MSIRSMDLCDRSLKLSEIAPISAPGNFEGAGPQKCVPRFSYLLDKFGEVPTGPKVIHRNMLTFAQKFEFWLPNIFSGCNQIVGLSFKAPPIFRHLAKFDGDRSRELGDLGPKCMQKSSCPPFFWWDAAPPHFGTYIV